MARKKDETETEKRFEKVRRGNKKQKKGIKNLEKLQEELKRTRNWPF